MDGKNGSKRTKLLTYGQVGEMLGYTEGTVRRKISDGELPFQKVKLTERAVRFRESEVEAYIAERSAASTGGES